MIEMRPRLIFVLLTNYVAFLSSTILFTIWKWLLDWPMPWIAIVLILRATYLSILHFPNLTLRYSSNSLEGPSGVMMKPAKISLAGGLEIFKILGLTMIKDSDENEINYRERWYPSKEMEVFNRHLSVIKSQLR